MKKLMFALLMTGSLLCNLNLEASSLLKDLIYILNPAPGPAVGPAPWQPIPPAPPKPTAPKIDMTIDLTVRDVCSDLTINIRWGDAPLDRYSETIDVTSSEVHKVYTFSAPAGYKSVSASAFCPDGTNSSRSAEQYMDEDFNYWTLTLAMP